MEQGVVGEGQELLERGPHLTRGAFKQASAAHREDSVAHEGRVVRLKDEANVAFGQKV